MLDQVIITYDIDASSKKLRNPTATNAEDTPETIQVAGLFNPKMDRVKSLGLACQKHLEASSIE